MNTKGVLYLTLWPPFPILFVYDVSFTALFPFAFRISAGWVVGESDFKWGLQNFAIYMTSEKNAYEKLKAWGW